MKEIVKLLLILIILIFIIYCAIFVFVNTKGKDIFVENVKEKLKKEVSIGSFFFKFPFNIEINNFACGNLSFRRADISLGVFNPFTFQLTLNRVYIDGFNLKIEKEGEKTSVPGFIFQERIFEFKREASTKKERVVSPIPLSLKTKKREIAFKINRLYLRNGLVEIVDLNSKEPVNFIFKDISFEIKNLLYPQLTKFYIKLNTSLKAKSVEIKDVLRARGWINYAKKDMDVNFNIDNLDYLVFSDYYPYFWKPENLGVKEALFSLQTNLNSQDNNLVADCILSLEKIEYVDSKEGEDSSRTKTLKTILTFLKGDRDKPSLYFKLKTKMSSPKLSFSLLRDEIEGKIGIPAFIVGAAVDKIKDMVSEEVKEAK